MSFTYIISGRKPPGSLRTAVFNANQRLILCWILRWILRWILIAT